MISLPNEDLDHLASLRKESVHDLNILVTGASGFIGKWVVSALRWSGRASRLTLVSRNPRGVKSIYSLDDDDSSIRVVHPGELSRMRNTSFDEVWHLAASTGAAGTSSWWDTFSADVDILTRLLQMAERQKSGFRIVYTSSGAVYGRNRLTPSVEDDTASFKLGSAGILYDTSKRMSETLLLAAADEVGIEVRIARLFAFVGPHLPLDQHFAIGNFLLDASRGMPIRLLSDGLAVRSWMYPTDLMTWLFRFADQGTFRIMNVGSDKAMSIRHCAELVGHIAGVEVHVPVGTSELRPREVYVPDVTRAVEDLGLRIQIDLVTAIRRTLEWLEKK